MSKTEHSKFTQFKGMICIQIVCVLGGKTVGKTYLSRKLSDNSTFAKYRLTTSIEQFSKISLQKGIKYIFCDYPSLDLLRITEFSCLNEADLLILLFKDSASFAELFQFLQKITKMSSENVFNNQSLLQKDCHIYLVYNSFEEKAIVQSDQLFKILEEEVRKINAGVEVKTFHWREVDFNAHAIRKSIEQIQVSKKSYFTETVTQYSERGDFPPNVPLLKKSESQAVVSSSELKDSYFSKLETVNKSQNENGLELYEVKSSKINYYRDSNKFKYKQNEDDESVDGSERQSDSLAKAKKRKIPNILTDQSVRAAHKRQRIELLKSEMNYMQNQYNKKQVQQRVPGLDSKTCSCEIM